MQGAFAIAGKKRKKCCVYGVLSLSWFLASLGFRVDADQVRCLFNNWIEFVDLPCILWMDLGHFLYSSSNWHRHVLLSEDRKLTSLTVKIVMLFLSQHATSKLILGSDCCDLDSSIWCVSVSCMARLDHPWFSLASFSAGLLLVRSATSLAGKSPCTYLGSSFLSWACWQLSLKLSGSLRWPDVWLDLE